jgi:hypothetical protein
LFFNCSSKFTQTGIFCCEKPSGNLEHVPWTLFQDDDPFVNGKSLTTSRSSGSLTPSRDKPPHRYHQAYISFQTRSRWCVKIFLRFLPIFGDKIGVFSQKQCNDSFLQKLAVHSLSKNANLFAKFFGENIFKIITSVPGLPDLFWTQNWKIPFKHIHYVPT